MSLATIIEMGAPYLTPRGPARHEPVQHVVLENVSFVES